MDYGKSGWCYKCFRASFGNYGNRVRISSHKSVAEAAVVGRKDDLKGEAIVAFISLEKDINSSPELVEELKKHVVNEIGIIAKPEKIIISDSLPKTRSGKIMRRILRSLAEGEKISGDISTLEDSSVLEKLKEIS